MAIAAACPAARSLGLHPGMAVTQARTLVPSLEITPADPSADKAFLADIALFAARRWTPIAAVCEPDGLWLDLSGVVHLFGGERRMCERILKYCARLGFDARIAVADTAGAAHALARFGQRNLILCPSGRESGAIAPLPPSALRLDDIIVAACRRFGIENIAELMAMPRGPLARRFGKLMLLRLDQALGRAAEPFNPVVPEEPHRASLRFAEPIASAESIEQVLADLVAILIARLEERGMGARQIILSCDRVDGAEQRIVIGTAAATRDAGHLLRLLKMRIEQIEPGFGIDAMHLVASRFEPFKPQQIDQSPESGAMERPLPPLVDRIASRIGFSHIFQCSAVESDVPERSVRQVPVMAPTKEWPLHWPRPVRLLPRPEPVDKVIAELPDQPPLRFSWRGEMHVIRKADGPERIYGEWWKHRAETRAVRDYFQVEDESGARFWIFRRGDGVDARTGDLSWHVHGIFA
jgi:protein ImuB